MRRKVLAMVLSAVMTAGVLAGCGNSSAEKSTADTKGTDSKEATYTVGISQFAEHGSLDNCREGFLEGLKEAGIEEGVNLDVILDNAQADTGTAATIADNFVSKNVDLICAIATPAAMSAYNSTKGTEIPVIYTAVSDPVAAQLATEDGTPVGNITGTSDALPVEEQLKMIRATLPDAKKIGILYTTSETNSESTIATYKELAGDYGFEIVDTGINTIADVEMAAKDLVTKVDCITNLTDNTVVSALQTVLAAANDAICIALCSSGMVAADNDERMMHCQNMLERGMAQGMDTEDLWFDPLFLVVKGMQDKQMEVLEAIKMFSDMGLNSTGGLSNNSNGMPKHIRPIMDSALVAMAMMNGLTSAIVNPNDLRLMETIKSCDVFKGNTLYADSYLEI